MQYKIIFIFIIFSFSSIAFSKQIKAKPLSIEITVIKNNFPVEFFTGIKLECSASERCLYGECDSHRVEKELTIQTSILDEDRNQIKYLVEYFDDEILKNPYNPIKYKDRSCSTEIFFKIEDSNYLNRDNKPVFAIHRYFDVSSFDELEKLDNIKLEYFYDWTRYNDGIQCSYKEPKLCKKFLHLKSFEQNPVRIKAISSDISSGTMYLFDDPRKDLL